MITAIIAEKPSVAKDIANVLGVRERHDGYLSGNDYLVTWAFGHLVQLAMPDAYGYTGFRRENLPIIPQEFKFIPRQIREGKEYKSDPGVLKQLKVIREVFAQSDRIIVATDAGREGEGIFRYIYNYLGCRKPFDRLWISSLTDRAIREGLENLKPGSSYDNLYRAAEARAIADWEIGLNATQALSIAAGQGIFSLGRVQTPTLMMICSRYMENKDFTPQTYYQIRVTAAKDGTPFSALSEHKYETLPAVNTALSAITATGTVTVADVQCKEVSQEPPLLYDLTSLQKEANSKLGFSADKTLNIAQSLYEAKVLSYPRTGSRYISDDVFDEIPSRIALLEQYPAFAAYAATLKGTALNRRSVDDKKVTDHHALIITECLPGELPEDQRKIYDMVAARLLESFSARCVKDVTTVHLTAGNSDFTAKGTVVKSAGWRAVRGERDEEEESAALPALQQGESFPLESAEPLEKQTKPKPLHTESSLLSAMESCGRNLDEAELRDSLKDIGIGTPATRASIIETLFSRDYVRREKKNLVPTEKGLAVYSTVKGKKIADVEMTGQWETALARIETGEMDAATFRKGIEVYAAQITEELLQVQVSVADGERIPCPKCQSGRILFYPKVAKCSNVDCGLTVFRSKGEKTLTDSQITDLVTKGKTSLIKGFKNRDGKVFDAHVTFDKDFRTVYDFPPKPKGKGGGR
ncbi:type IA DNA topoisomerase [Bacteroides fragilis]|uniref:type IA DNA topoisomerase n=1 Tax=Bacteroides fragilis TaxID=817 RepID=UPI00044E318C|nr:type IA DNA topoisomerase [Bacteroides fragilis]EXZ05162.1 DNA topoisomerase III family protein [Bacteroides fragilis str. DS-208]MCE8971890.1 DNA topoisomerase III [Bacteroides fragilis]